MQQLSELENSVIGALGGLIEVSIMQPMNYWKNATQQGIPLSMEPKVLYRGYFANATNMAACTCFQFAANGMFKKMLVVGDDPTAPLSPMRQLIAGFFSGAASASLCSPLELLMIQQQRKGGSLPSHAASLARGGLGTIYHGFTMTALREGIYSAGYLGVAPVIRESIMAMYPEMNEDVARIPAAIIGGGFCCYLSHPFATVKTCMQGDIERKKFGSSSATLSTLWNDAGGSARLSNAMATIYRGAMWRYARQVCAVFILDKARVTLAPLVFPSKFETESGAAF
jgi:hypothetical protein